MLFREYSYSVLVVSASDKLNNQLTAMLPENDYYPVNIVKSAGAAQRELLEKTYDIILVNTPLPDDFGVRLAINVANDFKSGVLLFVKSDVYDGVSSKVMEYGVLTLSKPSSASMVLQSLRLLCATQERMHGIEKKTASLEEKMEEIKIINHAKWMLIEYLKMTEEEAHRYIEKQAMDMRISKRSVAENILKTYR